MKTPMNIMIMGKNNVYIVNNRLDDITSPITVETAISITKATVGAKIAINV